MVYNIIVGWIGNPIIHNFSGGSEMETTFERSSNSDGTDIVFMEGSILVRLVCKDSKHAIMVKNALSHYCLHAIIEEKKPYL